MKQTIAFLMTSAVCLSLGYWTGSHPEYYQKYLDLNKKEILVYCNDVNALFPREFQKILETESPVKLKFTDDENSADLLLLDPAQFKKLPVNSVSDEREIWASLFKQVSPDFQIAIVRERKGIPILWKTEGKSLMLLSFWVQSTSKKTSTAWVFLKFFLSDKTQLRWLQFQKWNTTLMKFDETNIEESRKANSIRKVRLQGLVPL